MIVATVDVLVLTPAIVGVAAGGTVCFIYALACIAYGVVSWRRPMGDKLLEEWRVEVEYR